MTLLVKDEVDIVATNLDYHLAQGVDLIIATDHGSTDGTREVLRRYERDGVVHLICDDAEGHHQSRRVTHMARLAGDAYGADWIFHNDADEFWWPVAGSLRDVFASIPGPFGALQVWRRTNFLPVADGDGPFHERMIYREAQSRNLVGGPLEPKTAHRPDPDLVIEPGNHWLRGGGLAPAPFADMLEIFHFPMRGYEQFERKVVKLGLGYEAVAARSPEVGRDQLALLELQRHGELRAHFDDRIYVPAGGVPDADPPTVIADRRLQRFLAELSDGGAPIEHAGGAAVRALVNAGLDAALACERSNERLEMTTRERDIARAAARELEVTLEQLRSSRLLRLTDRPRRVWHRLIG